MKGVFPLVKKYGGAIIALTLDENGIPDTAEERFNIALKIIDTAAKYGIEKRDIIVDPLALTVSSNQESANITLKTIKMLKDAGIKTSLGVSNISFGLPRRELINSAFFTAALTSGLDCAIMNPFSADMMNSYFAYRALAGVDPACADYIAYASEAPSNEAAKPQSNPADLKTAVIKGVKETAVKAAEILSETTAPLEIIDKFVIPALDEIGTAFENKKAYLPQLLMSAEAASAAFEVIKRKIPDKAGENGKKFVIATVKGDIHDIGKNIVKVMLESYGFNVIDLGRDVDPKIVVETALTEGCKLVGLSALMTTTVPSMEETISLLHKADSNIKVVVGGVIVVLLSLLFGGDYNGAGVGVIERALAGDARPEAFLMKIIFTALTLSAGFKGGEIVPAFFCGATFGSFFGALLGLPASFAAAAGMTAVFCGVTNCPLTSILLSYELFGGEGLPLYALCCAVSYMLSGYYSLYHSQYIRHSKLKLEKVNMAEALKSVE